MTICMEETVSYLLGDLTYSGVTHDIIDSLAASLQEIGIEGEKNFRIDCSRILSADFSGLQLLYVWMQCARFRGVEPELVNLPDCLQQDMQRMGLENCFTGNGPHSKTPDMPLSADGPGKLLFQESNMPNSLGVKIH